MFSFIMQGEQQVMTATKNTPQLWGGIECTINRVQDRFFDQLDYSGHYTRDSDIASIAATGIEKIRYPVLWEKHEPVQGVAINWAYTENRVKALREKNIDIIAGLVHHGSGPAFTDLADENFPYLLADYAKQVAEKFPFINFYTPVNEPLTTARFSGLYGLWYPHKTDDASFLRILVNEMKAVVLSMQAIRSVNPQAKLVQTEDLCKTYSTRPLQYQASFENHRRWLTYDLLCGKVDEAHPLWKYFIKHGITQNDLAFFQDNICVPDIFGFNHYLTSERFLDSRINRYPASTHGGNKHHTYADVEAVRVEVKEEHGIEILLKEAWNRYKKPIAITEVHLHCHREDQLRRFQQVWKTGIKLREEGVQVEAVTAWAMLGSFGWNQLLTQPAGDYEPGVFDVRSGAARPTAIAGYLKQLSNNASSPIIDDAGWWQRNTRFFNRPLLSHNTISTLPNGQPVLIFGRNGTLGRAFAKQCSQRFLSYKSLSRQDCDITSEASVETAINLYKPWAIINAAGFVRVDDAEREAEQCFAENTKGPEILARLANRHGIRLISFSTDLVFDGVKNSAYVEGDAVNPLNVYGHTKAAAETLVLENDPHALLIRTSAFFGPSDEYNFVHYVRKSLSEYESIQVAKDVTISPTYVPHLVNATLDLLMDAESGIWHLTNNNEITWADLAYEVADRFHLNRHYINPVTNEELAYPARRPPYSALGSDRGVLLPGLETALNHYKQENGLWQNKKQAESRA